MKRYIPTQGRIIGIWLMLSPFFLFPSLTAQTYVNDGDDLQNGVNAASPGEVFIVPNGTYNDFEASFTAVATEGSPIHIKAESVGGVILTGESHFTFKKAAHIILDGFVFDGQDDNTLVKLEGSHHIRITRNVFELQTNEPIKWIFIGGYWNDYTFQYLSHHNRVDHNIFKNKTTPGHYITIDGSSNEEETDLRQSQYDRIDHNHFYNNGPRAANEQESIRIGWSKMSLSSGFTIVEHNLFEDCDGDPEIISVKSCDNIIRYNTFRRSYGTVSLRHGNRNRVEGNYFFGGGKANGTFVNSNGSSSALYTGGIRIYGTDHVIINNYMEGLQGTRWDAPITLTQGDAIDGSSSNLTKHFRAERVTIAHNTLVDNAYGIEIGFDNNGDYNKALKDITIANNLITGSSNSLVSYLDGNTPGSEVSWSNNIFFPTGSASLTSDGSSFSSSEVQLLDPALVLDASLWRTSSSTPTLPSSILNWTNDLDIDGQFRPDTSSVGADHFSQDSVLYGPLSPSDVGPLASSVATALTDFPLELELFLYPNPASSHLNILNAPKGSSSLMIYSLTGSLLAQYELHATTATVSLPQLASGLYVVRLSNASSQYVKRIFIQQ
ncbi:MAG: chondroitinase-B domain-containing protein [Bacteroidia bacterium]